MKFRDSGMPNEELWNTFFSPLEIIEKLKINNETDVILDIGCGYGTFLIPASTQIKGTAIGIDIDENMIISCLNKAKKDGVNNVKLIHGDISTDATLSELTDYIGRINYISLFNILHCENPLNLITNAYNLLNKQGKIGVIHWIHADTPRGPAMDIRPTPEKIINLAMQVGLSLDAQIDLPPYHYGLVFVK